MGSAQAAADRGRSRPDARSDLPTTPGSPPERPTALSRAVTALIDNALGHARSQVKVAVERRGRMVVVEVATTDPGSATTCCRGCSAGSRATDSETEAPGARRHFGLGLALVSEIATRHGGSSPPPTAGPRDRCRPAPGAAGEWSADVNAVIDDESW